jgi:hypothetical protein
MRSKTSIFCFPYAVLLGKICPFLGLPSQMASLQGQPSYKAGVNNPGGVREAGRWESLLKRGWFYPSSLASIRQKTLPTRDDACWPTLMGKVRKPFGRTAPLDQGLRPAPQNSPGFPKEIGSKADQRLG